MGYVIKLSRPRNKTIKGHARECLTEAIKQTGEPRAVIVVSLGIDGSFAVRSAHSSEMHLFDVYARAGHIMQHECGQCMAMED
jgi:hypothetical protein